MNTSQIIEVGPSKHELHHTFFPFNAGRCTASHDARSLKQREKNKQFTFKLTKFSPSDWSISGGGETMHANMNRITLQQWHACYFMKQVLCSGWHLRIGMFAIWLKINKNNTVQPTSPISYHLLPCVLNSQILPHSDTCIDHITSTHNKYC